MRSWSFSMSHPLPRLLAEDFDIFGFAALGQRLGLPDPVVALDAALEVQVAIDPLTLGLLPAGNLGEGVDAELMQNALDLRADAGDQLQVVESGGLVYALRAICIVERGLFSLGGLRLCGA